MERQETERMGAPSLPQLPLAIYTSFTIKMDLLKSNIAIKVIASIFRAILDSTIVNISADHHSRQSVDVLINPTLSLSTHTYAKISRCTYRIDSFQFK